jgi:hypothetical protein
MSYVLNFLVEILLILAYDLVSTGQTMNGSLFHLRWVAGIEVLIMTSVSKFLVHFNGQLGPFFITKMLKNARLQFLLTF